MDPSNDTYREMSWFPTVSHDCNAYAAPSNLGRVGVVFGDMLLNRAETDHGEGGRLGGGC